jgi:hypothetical protein
MSKTTKESRARKVFAIDRVLGLRQLTPTVTGDWCVPAAGDRRWLSPAASWRNEWRHVAGAGAVACWRFGIETWERPRPVASRCTISLRSMRLPCFLYLLLFITFVSLTKWLPFMKTFVQTFKISNAKLAKKKSPFLSMCRSLGRQMIYRRNSGVPNSNSLGSE